MDSKLVLIPKITIHPDKICLYKEVKWLDPKVSSKFNLENESEVQEVNEAFFKSARKNNGYLSAHAKRKLFKTIDYMIITSDRKKVYSKIQRKYISFKIVFITLTLPSAQVHSDKDITNKCFNQFLIELSQYHNVKRYVWRAEKQENGNIHYHLLINEFIEYQDLRKRWNRILNKLGYVDSYQAEMKEFFKNGFRMSINPNDKRSEAQQRKAYIIGQRSNWTSPNSTDIHDTRKVRDIKKYVGKYMAKQPDINLENVSSDADLNVVNGRLWSCSQNLSDLKGCQLTEDWQISDELEKIAKNSDCKMFYGDYFRVMFINIQDVRKYGSDLLFKYFSDYLLEKFNYHLPLKIAI